MSSSIWLCLTPSYILFTSISFFLHFFAFQKHYLLHYVIVNTDPEWPGVQFLSSFHFVAVASSDSLAIPMMLNQSTVLAFCDLAKFAG